MGLPPRIRRSERHRFRHRPGFAALVQAIRAAATAALAEAGIVMDDVALLDVYSCFPSAVQIAAEALGIGLDRRSP